MSMCFVIQKSFQFRRIDKVPIMGEAYAVGTVDVKGLRFRIGTTASSWVS